MVNQISQFLLSYGTFTFVRKSTEYKKGTRLLCANGNIKAHILRRCYTGQCGIVSTIFFSFSVASRLRHSLKYKLVTSSNTAPTLSPADFGLPEGGEWVGCKRLQCLMFNICYVFYNFRRVLLCWGRYKIMQSLCAFRTRPLLFIWKQIQTVMTTS